MDGCPVDIITYANEILISDKNEIIIGSNDCDINIYLIRIYNKHLTDIEHLNNFILDGATGQEIIKRY